MFLINIANKQTHTHTNLLRQNMNKMEFVQHGNILWSWGTESVLYCKVESVQSNMTHYKFIPVHNFLLAPLEFIFLQPDSLILFRNSLQHLARLNSLLAAGTFATSMESLCLAENILHLQASATVSKTGDI